MSEKPADSDASHVATTSAASSSSAPSSPVRTTLPLSASTSPSPSSSSSSSSASSLASSDSEDVGCDAVAAEDGRSTLVSSSTLGTSPQEQRVVALEPPWPELSNVPSLSAEDVLPNDYEAVFDQAVVEPAVPEPRRRADVLPPAGSGGEGTRSPRYTGSRSLAPVNQVERRALRQARQFRQLLLAQNSVRPEVTAKLKRRVMTPSRQQRERQVANEVISSMEQELSLLRTKHALLSHQYRALRQRHGELRDEMEAKKHRIQVPVIDAFDNVGDLSEPEESQGSGHVSGRVTTDEDVPGTGPGTPAVGSAAEVDATPDEPPQDAHYRTVSGSVHDVFSGLMSAMRYLSQKQEVDVIELESMRAGADYVADFFCIYRDYWPGRLVICEDYVAFLFVGEGRDVKRYMPMLFAQEDIVRIVVRSSPFDFVRLASRQRHPTSCAIDFHVNPSGAMAASADTTVHAPPQPQAQREPSPPRIPTPPRNPNLLSDEEYVPQDEWVDSDEEPESSAPMLQTKSRTAKEDEPVKSDPGPSPPPPPDEPAVGSLPVTHRFWGFEDFRRVLLALQGPDGTISNVRRRLADRIEDGTGHSAQALREQLGIDGRSRSNSTSKADADDDVHPAGEGRAFSGVLEHENFLTLTSPDQLDAEQRARLAILEQLRAQMRQGVAGSDESDGSWTPGSGESDYESDSYETDSGESAEEDDDVDDLVDLGGSSSRQHQRSASASAIEHMRAGQRNHSPYSPSKLGAPIHQAYEESKGRRRRRRRPKKRSESTLPNAMVSEDASAHVAAVAAAAMAAAASNAASMSSVAHSSARSQSMDITRHLAATAEYDPSAAIVLQGPLLDPLRVAPHLERYSREMTEIEKQLRHRLLDSASFPVAMQDRGVTVCSRDVRGKPAIHKVSALIHAMPHEVFQAVYSLDVRAVWDRGLLAEETRVIEQVDETTDIMYSVVPQPAKMISARDFIDVRRWRAEPNGGLVICYRGFQRYPNVPERRGTVRARNLTCGMVFSPVRSKEHANGNSCMLTVLAQTRLNGWIVQSVADSDFGLRKSWVDWVVALRDFLKSRDEQVLVPDASGVTSLM